MPLFFIKDEMITDCNHPFVEWLFAHGFTEEPDSKGGMISFDTGYLTIKVGKGQKTFVFGPLDEATDLQMDKSVWLVDVKTFMQRYLDEHQIWTEVLTPTKEHKGVYGIIRQGRKILVIKKARGPYTGLYDLPAVKTVLSAQEKMPARKKLAPKTIAKKTSLKKTSKTATARKTSAKTSTKKHATTATKKTTAKK